MNEVGEKLKEARKAKGYTLDDLQQMTKIQKRYLIAVEEGNLEVLPGNFYARAFIKQYADTVGLDGEQLLRDHSDIPKAKNDEYSEKVITTQTRSKPKSSSIMDTIQDSLPTILIILLVLSIAVVFYWAVVKGSNDSDTPVIQDKTSEKQDVEVGSNESTDSESETDEDTDQKDQPAEEPKEEENDEKEELNITQTSSNGGTTNFTVSGTIPKEQQITLTAEGGESWVSVSVDGKTVDQSLLTDGNSLSSKFDQDSSTVTVVIGNAAVTSVQLNDQAVSYAEESANAVRQELIFEFE
ncbi:helix-turn-helix domain-containing protein [Marinilactibacillus psychrotolerans]|uniref:Transcriptional regulator in cluster with unspecified monosaccharide ABC transport system n=1 Tax=Marinilactibacillus psychrotolerans 42ea TaxID=1255609 RepID=A0A1R4JE28_9LACT|nr:RodZ domain-containing protein [Marinilactibacillus psychrotolerans]GEQ34400.1 transcriptional regulator [Marinilactibacillus psychrotolerans]SJN30194.1 Transcriptional regulator in cluster with unspecified monosaccharide ABC transport system [Marinilactibacillus psychrotolerans 42ea]